MIGMPGGRGGILNLAIKEKMVLYQAFMPFIKNGGIFIPTNKAYKMGEEVFMLLSLMSEAEKVPVAGKIIWMTPKGAGTNKIAGIGVQFNDQNENAKKKIETFLAGTIGSEVPTHTL